MQPGKILFFSSRDTKKSSSGDTSAVTDEQAPASPGLVIRNNGIGSVKHQYAKESFEMSDRIHFSITVPFI